MAVMWQLLSCVLLLPLVLFSLLRRPRRALPPGPRGWPLVGALPLLGRMPHVNLAALANKYGPIMYLKMGTCGVAIASSPSAVCAFLKTHDLNFSYRPVTAGVKYVAYGGQDLVFADYGPRWKLLRKLCNLHMLGGKALEGSASLRRSEAGIMLRSMYLSSLRAEPVMLKEVLVHAMANILGQIMLSRRVFDAKESKEFKDMVVELFNLTGKLNVGDFIPSIAWMDLQGIEGRLKQLHKRFDAVLTKMVEEHRTTMHEREGKPDFFDIVMSNCENDDDDSVKLTDVNIKALLLNLLSAGTDTTAITIEWAVAEMLKNPEILRRAQSEMDGVIGRERRLEESDLPNLPYLHAVCKEALRKHPSTPLSLPRVSAEACEADGYYIPAKTRLLVNIWAIGRNSEVWDDPDEFDPERFLSGRGARVEPQGDGFELVPFGAGRRVCVGARMAMLTAEFLLGTLVHSFDWKVPDGVDFNMDEAFGLALQKAEPLSAVVTPRLPPNIYV